MRNLHGTPVTQVLRFYGWAPGLRGELYMVTELCGRGGLLLIISRFKHEDPADLITRVQGIFDSGIGGMKKNRRYHKLTNT